MKSIMKSLGTIILLSVYASTGNAGTDWDRLIRMAPKLKSELVSFGSEGEVTGSAVVLSAENLRLTEITQLAFKKKPNLVIGVKEEQLQRACENFARFRKSFSATLNLNLGPKNLDLAGVMASGKKVHFKQIENQPLIAAPVPSFSKRQVGFSFYDSNSETRTYSDIWAYYVDFLQKKIQQSDDNIVSIDLSKHNGLACDLALGISVLDLRRKVSVEPGLPSKESWMTVSNFTSIYQDFWSNMSKLEAGERDESNRTTLDLVTLGMSISGKLAFTDLSEKAERIFLLLSALKIGETENSVNDRLRAEAKDLSKNYFATQEYVKPKVKTVNYSLSLMVPGLFVEFEK